MGEKHRGGIPCINATAMTPRKQSLDRGSSVLCCHVSTVAPEWTNQTLAPESSFFAFLRGDLEANFDPPAPVEGVGVALDCNVQLHH